MKNGLVFFPGQGGFSGIGRVYRDGEGVVVIGRVDLTKKTAMGDVDISSDVVVRFKSIAAYDYAKTKAAEKDLVRYAQLVGVWNEDDRAEDAPELPDALRQAIARRAAAGRTAIEEGATILRLPERIDDQIEAIEPAPARPNAPAIELLAPGEEAA